MDKIHELNLYRKNIYRTYENMHYFTLNKNAK